MKNKKRILSMLLVAVFVIALAGCGNKADTKVVKYEAEEEKAGIFEEMETVDIEGNPVDQTIFAENKLTLVNVWNTGCPPCINEIPELDKLNNEMKDQKVAVLGLVYEMKPGLTDRDLEAVNEILSSAGTTYQHITVSQDMIETKEIQSLVAFPTTFFVDSEGQILGSIKGANDLEGWKEIVTQVLSEME